MKESNSIRDAIVAFVHSHRRGKRIYCAKDFLRLGSRAAVDQALSRLTKAGTLRRVGRGLYDWPRVNPVVKRTVPPDPYSALKTIARKNDLRIFPSGMAAANSLGLTNAVQVTPVFGTDGRSRTVKIGNTSVSLKHAGREVLAWASRPAFNAFLALSWLGEAVVSRSPDIPGILREKLSQRQKRDLLKGLADLPPWMVPVVREIAVVEA